MRRSVPEGEARGSGREVEPVVRGGDDGHVHREGECGACAEDLIW